MVSYLKQLPILSWHTYIFLKGNLTLTSIEFHSHRYVRVPPGWTDPNVASFNERLKFLTNNCVRVCVSRNLSEGENSRPLHIEIVLSYYLDYFKYLQDLCTAEALSRTNFLYAADISCSALYYCFQDCKSLKLGS